MQPIRRAPTASQADEWALVLDAVGIPTAVEPDAGGWVVLAPADDLASAQAALDAYDRERDEKLRRDTAPRAEPYPWMSGIALALLLLWSFTVTGTRPSPWFDGGAADAGRIASGELWRTVTALTLHADVLHVVGNALALAILFPPLVQRFGAGVALLLLLATGAVGNVLAALFHDPRHIAVGASTAVFGAVGVLAALQLVPGERATIGKKRWTAPVAGVLLLVTLGVGPNSDLAAHAFGFAAGAALGPVAGLAIHGRPARSTQWITGTFAAAVVALCWWLALPQPP